MAGRPRKPTAIIELQGTGNVTRLRKRREPVYPDDIDMPKGMSPKAKLAWGQVADMLRAAGVLTKADVVALRSFCETYALWLEAHKKIQEEGMVFIDQNGIPKKSPYFSIATETNAQITRMLTEFGMTPASRSKVGSKEEDNEKDSDPWTQVS